MMPIREDAPQPSNATGKATGPESHPSSTLPERVKPHSPGQDAASPSSQEREALLARASLEKPGKLGRLRSGSYGSKGDVTEAAPPVRRGSPASSGKESPLPPKYGKVPLRRGSAPAQVLKKDSTGEKETSTAKDGSTLVMAFALMIFVGTGNRVFMKLQTYPMYNYPFFLTMLSTFIYVPVCFAYIIPMLAFGSSITPEQRAVPKFKFAVMGLLDSVAGIMGVFAVNYINNAAMIVLLQQAAIPISMSISKLFLGARYSVSQYVGASVVIAGIIVTLIPTLFGHPAGGSDADAGSQIVWSGVQVLSCIPMCLSSVYKEKALGDDDMDVIYLNGWVAVFQFLAGLLFAVPSAYAMNLPVAELPQNTYDGYMCFLGHNSQLDDYSMADMAAGMRSVPTDHCETAPLFVSLYLCFNLIYNVVLIVILKYGSANVLFLASTVMVPIGNVAFSLKFVPHHQDLKPSDTMGLVFILTGLVVYRFSEPALAFLRGSTRKSSLERESERQAKKKMSKFVGINQMEYLEPLIQRQNWSQRARLLRSPEQIRSSFMHRLGLPPSPRVAATPTARSSSPYRSVPIGVSNSKASPTAYRVSPGAYRASPGGYRASPSGYRASPGGFRSSPAGILASSYNNSRTSSALGNRAIQETYGSITPGSVGSSRKVFMPDRSDAV